MNRTVVHVLEAFAGGTERHLLDLVRHVPGVEHVLAVPSRHLGESTGAAVERARGLGAEVELVEMTRTAAQHRNLGALRSLRRLIARRSPDVLHAHSSIAGVLTRLAAPRGALPVVYTPNGLSRSPAALAVERSLGSRTTRLIAVSRGEREFALRHRLAPADRIVVIPNGIDLEPPPPLEPPLRARLGIEQGAPLVASLGRLTRQKAPEVYVEACGLAGRRIPEAHFLLVGRGPRRPSVGRAIRHTGLARRFHWLPGLPDAASAFHELDVYVLASRFEGAPYTPLEAMRAAVAVIVSDAAGNRDTVEDGVTGRVVPVDDPGALAAAMVDLLSDPDRRRAWGRAGRSRLEERFDARGMADATAQLYEDVARAAGDRRGIVRPRATAARMP